jgi:hypothetical protein
MDLPIRLRGVVPNLLSIGKILLLLLLILVCVIALTESLHF